MCCQMCCQMLTVDNILSSEDVCDKVRSAWRLYQTEIIPEDAYLNEKQVTNKNKAESFISGESIRHCWYN